MGQLNRPYVQRAPLQTAHLQLPTYPTTTIGSFPQTAEIRRTRSDFKAGDIGYSVYEGAIRAEIARCVREQKALGLDDWLWPFANMPTQANMVHLLQQAARHIPAQRLWVNPDCGLKTRQWSEVIPALQAIFLVASSLRQSKN